MFALFGVADRAVSQALPGGGADPVPPSVRIVANDGSVGGFSLVIAGADNGAAGGPTGIIYRTPHEIRNARMMQFPASAIAIPATPDNPNATQPTPPVRHTTIVLWNELHNLTSANGQLLPGEDGKLHPYRAIRLGGRARFPAGGSPPSEPGIPLSEWEEPGEGTWNSGDSDGDCTFDAGFISIGEIDYRFLLRYAEFNPLGLTSSGAGVPPVSPELEPWRVGEPTVPAGLSAADVPAYDVDDDGVIDSTGYSGGGCHVYMVQFWTEPLDEYRAELQTAGATIRNYLPENAYLTEMSVDAAVRVNALRCVRWVGPCHPAYKLQPSLIEECFGVPGGDPRVPARRYDIHVPASTPQRKEALARRITATGATLEEYSPRGVLISATMTATQLSRVVQADELGFVNLWGPAADDMVNARIVGGATALALPANGGFTGRGVRGEVMDSIFNPMHVDWTIPDSPPVSRVIRHGLEEGSVVNLPHGNATYGIAFGDGTGRPTAMGMLPGAGHGTDTEGGGIFASRTRLIQNGGMFSRFDHTAELVGYQTAATNYRAVFQSNSWGTEPNVLAYDTRSADLDDIVWRMDLLVCNSLGNTGENTGRQEAWAKNVVAIGGVDHKDTESKTDDSWPQVPYSIPRSADNTCGSSLYPPFCSVSPCTSCCSTCNPALGCCDVSAPPALVRPRTGASSLISVISTTGSKQRSVRTLGTQILTLVISVVPAAPHRSSPGTSDCSSRCGTSRSFPGSAAAPLSLPAVHTRPRRGPC